MGRIPLNVFALVACLVLVHVSARPGSSVKSRGGKDGGGGGLKGMSALTEDGDVDSLQTFENADAVIDQRAHDRERREAEVSPPSTEANIEMTTAASVSESDSTYTTPAGDNPTTPLIPNTTPRYYYATPSYYQTTRSYYGTSPRDYATGADDYTTTLSPYTTPIPYTSTVSADSTTEGSVSTTQIPASTTGGSDEESNKSKSKHKGKGEWKEHGKKKGKSKKNTKCSEESSESLSDSEEKNLVSELYDENTAAERFAPEE